MSELDIKKIPWTDSEESYFSVENDRHLTPEEIADCFACPSLALALEWIENNGHTWKKCTKPGCSTEVRKTFKRGKAGEPEWFVSVTKRGCDELK